MSVRHLIIGVAFALCLGTGSAVMVQRQQLRNLRAQQAEVPIQATAATASREEPQSASFENDDLAELLRLRSEVTQLTVRKRELAGVAAEAERLKAQLAMAQTNANRLPAGYIRRAEAQMVGFSTPENTLQTFLYAIQHRDAGLALQAVTPQQAERLRGRLDSSDPEHGFFKQAAEIPGLAIQGRQTKPDGSIELQVSPAPGAPAQPIHFELVSGQWKLDEGF